MRSLSVLFAITLAAQVSCEVSHSAPAVDATPSRRTQLLVDDWKFLQNDTLSDRAALAADGHGWTTVSLPHTWNAHDAATTHATKPDERGVGWYRLVFDAPTAGARHWLEFGAASSVADVWLDGRYLGEHAGAFTAFRFDVTDQLAKRGKHVLLVKVDNSAPRTAADRTAILPLASDFNMSGGLYRHVALVSTLDAVHVDLADLGGPGVYATTADVRGRDATVNVRTRLKSDARRDGRYVVRTSLLDADGRVATVANDALTLPAGAVREIAQQLRVTDAHLWQGVTDSYQYKLVVDVRRSTGEAVDKVVQDFGIRTMRFDPDRGLFLNGKHTPLRGVAMHQDYFERGWAITNQDIDESLALVKEVGANTVRFGHYPFSQYALERANRLGLVVWAEHPFGIGVTVPPCATGDPTPALRENSRQQLQEMIRQHANHASIGMWSIGSAKPAVAKTCPAPRDDTPILRALHALAKREDPSRPTTLADVAERVEPASVGDYIAVGGITDLWATSQYYLWYGGAVSGLGELLDTLHDRYPDQPLGVSEYGAGAALSHHTDDPLGGPAETTNPGVPVVYQPEEYAAYVHEQNYAVLAGKPYLWGTYVGSMFDFGAGKNEGDAQGVSTTGLVSFDRKTRKEPFYFYKANWSSEPVTHVVGERYTKRAYPTADIKVYSNADRVDLFIGGKHVGSRTAERCALRTCVFEEVPLARGTIEVLAVGNHDGRLVRDAVTWSYDREAVNIAAGQLATGFTSSDGELFGSDHYFVGGAATWLVEKAPGGVTDRTAVRGTRDRHLYKNYRHGTFSYDVPMPNGRYIVTLGFLEPHRRTRVGSRVFDVEANGEPQIRDLDVLKQAGWYRTVVTKRFATVVDDGRLRLDFKPALGEAVVSTIMIAPAGETARRTP